MKRLFAVLLITVLLIVSLANCSLTDESVDNGDTRFTIVSTIFPPYDWVRQILGDNIACFDISFLTDSGVDLHSFQPSVSDIARIASSDMFIYVGGHSDAWVIDILNGQVNPNMIVINLMEVLGIRDGYCDVYEHNHSHSHDYYCDDEHHHHDCNHAHHHDDEHVWLSLNFAKTLSAAIADALIQLDPDNAGQYRTNLYAYVGELWALNAEYQAAVSAAATRTILVADRFPFIHLVADYGLHHYAVFPGCHAETEASFATLAFLIGRVNDLGLSTILVTESSDQSIARTIARDAAGTPQILVLDSMQSISARDVQNGVTYISVMRSNLAVLQDALK